MRAALQQLKIILKDRHSRLQIDIIKANKALRYLYGLLPRGTFGNEEVDEIVGEACERMSLKEAARARLTATVAAEASAQVEDHITNEEGEELDE